MRKKSNTGRGFLERQERNQKRERVAERREKNNGSGPKKRDGKIEGESMVFHLIDRASVVGIFLKVFFLLFGYLERLGEVHRRRRSLGRRRQQRSPDSWKRRRDRRKRGF